MYITGKKTHKRLRLHLREWPCLCLLSYFISGTVILYLLTFRSSSNVCISLCVSLYSAQSVYLRMPKHVPGTPPPKSISLCICSQALWQLKLLLDRRSVGTVHPSSKGEILLRTHNNYHAAEPWVRNFKKWEGYLEAWDMHYTARAY